MEKKTTVGEEKKSNPLMIFKPSPHLLAELERITFMYFSVLKSVKSPFYIVSGGVMIHSFADDVFCHT